MTPRRPVLRYHGGKWRLARWIISYFPPHRVYVEPFGGAGSVLLRKRPARAEVYNDLDGEVVNLFRVLRDPERAEQLRRLLELTPYARGEFEDSYGQSTDPIERARRICIRSGMGFGSTWRSQKRTGFREVIRQQDGPEVLFYVDPPYPLSTRTGTRWPCEINDRAYAHDLTDDEHRELAQVLRSVKGMVVLSGYACELYDDELYPDWHRTTKATIGDGAVKRTEVLWINQAAADHGAPLFAGANA